MSDDAPYAWLRPLTGIAADVSLAGRLASHAASTAARRWAQGPYLAGWSFTLETLMAALWDDREEAGRRPKDLAGQRRRIERASARSLLAERLRATPEIELRTPSAWFRTSDADLGAQARPLVLLLGDGGLVSAAPDLHADLAARIATGAGMTVCALSVGAAPESSFEAAWDAVADAVDRAIGAGRRVFFVGVGPGASLAVSVALFHGGVERIWAITPWFDLSMSSPSYHDRAEFDWLCPPAMREAARAWAAGRSLRDPALSPLFAQLDRLPPTLIHAGDAAVTRDDAYAFAARAASIGRQVTLVPGRSMPHAWPVFAGLATDGRPAVAQGVAFLRDA